MSLVGKLLKQAVLGVTSQPWMELVFPATCISCGQALSETSRNCAHPPNAQELIKLPKSSPAAGSTAGFQQWQVAHWCHACWSQLNAPPRIGCTKCGAKLMRPSPFAEHCGYCLQAGLKFDQAISVGNYAGLVRELVIRMKNRHDDVLAIHLGKCLAYELLAQGWTDFDQIIPVPLHWSRRLKRGFQATEMLSDQISQVTGIGRCTRALSMLRSTAKQGTLSATSRVSNVRNAFQVRRKFLKPGARVLLVDDVMTSGATTSEIARVLKSAGAESVTVAVIARGGVH